MTMSTHDQNGGIKITGRHVLFAMIGFFGVIFAVNGIFLYQAIGSYTGLVSDEPYRKGLNYNDRILADSVQHTLGWKHVLKVSKDGKVEVSITDSSGDPIRELEVNMRIGRPSTTQGEVLLSLKPNSAGVYQAEAGQLPLGNLLSSIEIKRMDRSGEMVTAYRAKERIWLKP